MLAVSFTRGLSGRWWLSPTRMGSRAGDARKRPRMVRFCIRFWQSARIWSLITAGLIAAPVGAKEHLVEVAWSSRGDYQSELQIASRKFKELCVALKRGDRVEWWFSSPHDLSFNIHYHAGSDVSYPAKVDGIRAAQGTLEVPIDQDYCWLWKAGADPAAVVTGLKKKTLQAQ